ncbi:hypothetical protein LZ009_21710 [Ramlibacter sp. XY19]|uniref:hypothetical protein n=1 Tax=Ramlibacter paludis TaxID=2908000 RepID=UPI0023D9A846|nr:hypothetical protein [Ramlibacter paludis]MCG2595404.1 hypothetical protein [Ramlibacter paludis]
MPDAADPPAPEGFPRIYAVAKWIVVGSLALLTIVAAAFWAVLLGGFAGSGFRAVEPAGAPQEAVEITPECAWPYSVHDEHAKAVCRMFYHLTPEQRAKALKGRQ